MAADWSIFNTFAKKSELYYEIWKLKNSITFSGGTGGTGTSGTSGINGNSGTSGANGSSGSSGTSGANGSSGTSGSNGTAGSSGSSGTSGTSVAVGGTQHYIVKFTSPTTIGNTTIPVFEDTSANTIVIGGTTADSTKSAILELQSNTRGFLPSRMTEGERLIINPAIGLMVYQTDGDEGLWIYKSGGWVQII